MNTTDGQVLYCREPRCTINSRQTPATVLLCTASQPQGTLPCDDCARSVYETWPAGTVELKPVSGYVDMFAAAKQAAFATPGQVIRGEVAAQAEPAYQAPVPEPEPVPVMPAAPVQPVSKVPNKVLAWWALGISLVSFTLGCVLTSIAGAMNTHYMNSLQNWEKVMPTAPSGMDALNGWGNFCIIISILTWVIFGIVVAARAGAQKARAYRAWKASLSPEDRRKAELAELAAAAAGVYAVHEGLKAWSRHTEESTAKYRANAESFRQRQEQTHARWAQEAAATQERLSGNQYPTTPGPTKHSGIYGNYI